MKLPLFFLIILLRPYLIRRFPEPQVQQICVRISPSEILRNAPSFTVKVPEGIFRHKKGVTDVVFLFPSYERKVKREVMKIISEETEGYFIDVGAHVGLYTIMVGKKWRGKVIAIEPERLNFEALTYNVRLNGLKNVITVRKACFSRSGKVKLYLSRCSGRHSLIGLPTQRYEIVEAVKLDDLLRDYNVEPSEVRLLKIDVEGSEVYVLKGCRNLLKTGKPVIIFEALTQHNYKKCKEFLRRFGYKVKRIEKLNFIALPKPNL